MTKPNLIEKEWEEFKSTAFINLNPRDEKLLRRVFFDGALSASTLLLGHDAEALYKTFSLLGKEFRAFAEEESKDR